MDYPIITGSFASPGGRPLTIAYRENTNDFNTVSATLTGDEYHLPRGLSGHAVDVGGYLGTVGIALAADNPALRVTIVEPVPPNAALIRRNIELNGLSDRITLIEGAVGMGGEPVEVWYGYTGTVSAEHHAFVGNSTLAYDNGGELPHLTARYVAIGLDEFGPLAFLKIDCEGGEWAFLSGDCSAVATIVGEAHAVRGRKGGDIVDLLAATHDVTTDGDPEATCEFAAVRR